jgi:hypothetical protein
MLGGHHQDLDGTHRCVDYELYEVIEKRSLHQPPWLPVIAYAQVARTIKWTPPNLSSKETSWNGILSDTSQYGNLIFIRLVLQSLDIVLCCAKRKEACQACRTMLAWYTTAWGHAYVIRSGDFHTTCCMRGRYWTLENRISVKIVPHYIFFSLVNI